MARKMFNGEPYVAIEEPDENGELRVVLDENSYEVMDPVPLAPPVGYKKRPSITEIIREQIRSERLAMEAEAAGYETFEEAEDFDIEDDFDIQTQWENDFDPSIQEVVQEVEKERKSRSKKLPDLDPKASETQVSSDADGLD